MSVLTDLRSLLRERGYRRLFTVRMVSQGGDGIFEIGLAGLFFFSPQSAATAGGVALAFAIMLLPFTIIGPWAGVFLDRWSRRQVLLIGNLLRAAITAGIVAAMIGLGSTSAVVYVLALMCLAVNRFLLAALSAGLPRVIPPNTLVVANSVTPTLGTLGFSAGAGLAGLVRVGVGVLTDTPGSDLPLWTADALVLFLAIIAFLAAALCSLRIRRAQLGPDASEAKIPLASQFSSLAKDLADGARYLVRRRTPAWGLGVMGAHRFLYGIAFVASILISRNLLADSSDATQGLARFGVLAAGAAAGVALAVVVTPFVLQRLTPAQWIVACLMLAALSQLSLVITYALPVMIAVSLLLGLAAQGVKISVDTIVQRDVTDDHRGRAFAFYDVLYNAAFVAAAALAAITLPDSGYSRGLFAAVAIAYVAAGLAYSRTPSTASDLADQQEHPQEAQ